MGLGNSQKKKHQTDETWTEFYINSQKLNIIWEHEVVKKHSQNINFVDGDISFVLFLGVDGVEWLR